MSATNGGPAFPTAFRPDDSEPACRIHSDFGGMTLRDYFAAKAMQGMLANGIEAHITGDIVAEWAYVYADAMLEKRAR